MDLLNCPFCGSTDLDESMAMGRDERGQETHAAGCYTCGACGPDAPTVELAARLWNGRAVLA
jgi:Lar family restriction alleviation protein